MSQLIKPDDIARLPVLFEDDEEGERGESSLHTANTGILYVCLNAFLKCKQGYYAFSNLDLHYHPKIARASVSPDAMVVSLDKKPYDFQRYRIGKDGPAPWVAVEVLSDRSEQQRDLTDKIALYALLKVPEYILVDPTGEFMAERLVLKRLQEDGTWCKERDADGAVTSFLGFRLILEADRQLRIFDAITGTPYFRPSEAQEAIDSRQQAQERIRELEARVARLRDMPKWPNKRRKKT